MLVDNAFFFNGIDDIGQLILRNVRIIRHLIRPGFGEKLDYFRNDPDKGEEDNAEHTQERSVLHRVIVGIGVGDHLGNDLAEDKYDDC